MGILFWNSVVPSFDGIVLRAATFHVMILSDFTGSAFMGIFCNAGAVFRGGGDIGLSVDMTNGCSLLFLVLILGSTAKRF